MFFSNKATFISSTHIVHPTPIQIRPKITSHNEKEIDVAYGRYFGYCNFSNMLYLSILSLNMKIIQELFSLLSFTIFTQQVQQYNG